MRCRYALVTDQTLRAAAQAVSGNEIGVNAGGRDVSIKQRPVAVADEAIRRCWSGDEDEAEESGYALCVPRCGCESANCCSAFRLARMTDNARFAAPTFELRSAARALRPATPCACGEAVPAPTVGPTDGVASPPLPSTRTSSGEITGCAHRPHGGKGIATHQRCARASILDGGSAARAPVRQSSRAAPRARAQHSRAPARRQSAGPAHR